MKHISIKLGSLLLALLLIIGLVPVVTFAKTGATTGENSDITEEAPPSSDGEAKKEIIAFDALDGDVAQQTVPPGTAKESLHLPDILMGTAQTDGEPTAEEIPVIRWKASPEYPSEGVGNYLFTPQLGGGYVPAEEVEMPFISVTVAAVIRPAAGTETEIDLDTLSKTDGTIYKYEPKAFLQTVAVLTIKAGSSNITIKSGGGKTHSDKQILIEAGYTGTLTLDNITLDLASTGSSGAIPSYGKSPIELKSSATLNLNLKGTSTLKGGNKMPGIHVYYGSRSSYSKLTIASASGGTLNAYGGKGGAGIGGYGTLTPIPTSLHTRYGSITIKSGTVNAYGGADGGAGIGSGHEPITLVSDALYVPQIAIQGGTVKAVGGDGASGIGGGENSTGGYVKITGGVTTAIAGEKGAGIGSGDNGSAVSLQSVTAIIEGPAVVTATGSTTGAGIGGGKGMPGGFVSIINGAKVTTNGAGNNAHSNSIGSGNNLNIISGVLGRVGGTLQVKDSELSMDCADTNANYVMFSNAQLTGCKDIKRINVESITANKNTIEQVETATFTIKLNKPSAAETPTGILRVVIHPPTQDNLETGEVAIVDDVAVFTKDITLTPDKTNYTLDVPGKTNGLQLGTDYTVTARYMPGEKDSYQAGSSMRVTNFKVVAVRVPDIPNALYNPVDNTLTQVDSTMSYRVDGGEWQPIAAATVSALLSTAQQKDGALVEVKAVSATGVSSAIETIATSPLKLLDTLSAMPVESAGTATGKITGFDDSSAFRYEYKKDGATEWTAVSGSSVTGLEAGDYKVRLAATETTAATSAVTLTVANRQAAPAIDAVGYDADTREIIGLPPGTEYRIGGGDWRQADDNGTIKLTDETEETLINNPSLELRTPASNGNEPSETVVKTFEVKPHPSGLYAEPGSGGGGGKILGLESDKTYQYKGDDGVWHDVSGKTEITDLTPGSYDIRLKGENQILPSISLVIGVPQTNSAPSTAYIDGKTLTLLGIDQTMEYEINGNGSWVTVEDGVNEVDLSGKNITEGTVLAVRYINAADPELKQLITLTKATLSTQNLEATDASSSTAQDGAIKGLSADNNYEYKHGDTDWIVVPHGDTAIESLAGGSYALRLAGGINTLPSDAETIVVLYQSASPSASYNPQTNTLENVSSALEYSTDGGQTWTAIAGGTVSNLFTEDEIKETITLQVRDKGTAGVSSPSAPQVITLTPADPIPSDSITSEAATGNLNNGKISGLLEESVYQYRKQGDTGWVTVSGTSGIDGLAPGNYELRKAGENNTLPSESLTVSVNQVAKTPAADALIFDGATVTLNGVDDTMEYRLGSGEWTRVPNGETSLNFSDLDTFIALINAKEIQVRGAGDGTMEPSPAVTLVVEPQPCPQSLNLVATPPSTATAQDGAIGGFVEGVKYEYKKADSDDWLGSFTGPDITNLAAGSYQFRRAGEGNKLPSMPTNPFVLKYSQTAPNATFNSSINQLSGVVNGMEYRVNGGAWQAITAPTVDNALTSDQLVDGTAIEIRYAETAEALASAPQTITLEIKDYGEALTQIVPVSVTTPGGDDGKLTNLDADTRYEYRKEGDTIWTAVPPQSTELTDLAPGIYEVRVAGDGEVLPSEAIPLVIKDVAQKPTTPAFDGDDMTLTGTEDGYEYRIGTEGDWTPITDDPFDMTALTEALQKNPYLEIRQGGTGEKEPSEALVIPLQTQEKPTNINASVDDGKGSGKLTGLDPSKNYEIKYPGSNQWQDIAPGSNHLDGLAAGDYELRLKGSGNTLPGGAVTVTVKALEKPSEPNKPTIPVPAPKPTPGAPHPFSAGTAATSRFTTTLYSLHAPQEKDKDTSDREDKAADDGESSVTSKSNADSSATGEVEKESGTTKWWIWVLIPIALLLIMLILLAARRRKEDDEFEA